MTGGDPFRNGGGPFGVHIESLFSMTSKAIKFAGMWEHCIVSARGPLDIS